jgi:hypothetical protein
VSSRRPTLTVDQPADGATFENGAIPIQGRTTNAGTVVVTAEYLGPGYDRWQGSDAAATRQALRR